MVRRIGDSTSPYYLFLALIFLGLTGCPPASRPQPQAAPGAGAGAGRAGIGQAEPGRGGPGGARPSERSSLEALRRGETPAGTAASPLKEIYFDYDRYDVRGEAREVLRSNAGWLKSNPQVRVQVEGHADERGTNEYNLALGAKRAQAAKDYLVTLGIVESRLTTISYGEEVPVCKEQNEACWQKNRRARFVPSAGRPGS